MINIINNQMNSNCHTCSQEIATNSNTVKYKCGHVFHRNCLLPKKMSILNPMCKKCENGMLDGYPTSCDEDASEDDDYYEDEDDEELTKYENAIVWQLSVVVVSLIGVLISMA